jgi:N-methylhydantoinase A
VGVDIGGTFTDIVLLASDGAVATKKVLSTPDDYGRAIATGLRELIAESGVDASAIDGVVHGTTVVTNAIIEKKGAKTALVTTAGFRDILELRRLRIPELYNFFYDKVSPLVPRRWVFEVDERMGPHGDVKRPLDEKSVRAAIERVRKAGIEALAICFLHSYANPRHERRVADMARAALPGVFVTCSADVLPEIREYERTSTTVINAYAGPVVASYLSSLLDKLRTIGVGAPLQIMQSNGGIMRADAILRKPACIVESGPAAGVIGGARSATLSGYPKIITIDMGGTTAKASMVEDGRVAKTSEYEVGAGISLSSQLVKGRGHALKLPVIDVSEIGAGGGSLVRVDKDGRLHVGPRSAGAAPGPVCYDQGGEEPTLTDAHVVLGYINPEFLVGGEMRLNAEKSRHAMAERVAKPLAKGLLEAAYGAHVVAGATMMRAVKAVTTYRGRDPRDFVLFAFGGNGPVLAAEVATQLRMTRVVVPPSPGLFSAFGLLFSKTEHEYAQTLFRAALEVSAGEVEGVFAALQDQARQALAGDGYGPGQMNFVREADLRYSGQAYELTIPAGGCAGGTSMMADLVERFGEEHLRTYGHRADDEPVDLVNLRVVGWAEPSGPKTIDPAAAIGGHGRGPTGPRRARRAYFGAAPGCLEIPVIARTDLSGRPTDGPFVVEEYDATTVVPPGWTAALDASGNVVMTCG